MGTYTTNYNLFMPTVGETGWGTLVNGNFSTIDTTMKNLSNRITAVENEVNGNLSCTSVTTSGKITGNGGIAGTTGTFSGAVTGTTFNGATITSTKFNGATIASNGNITAGTYNGIVLKTGVLTVTPTSGGFYIPVHVETNSGPVYHGMLNVLPLQPDITYTGTLKFHNSYGIDGQISYWDGTQNDGKFVVINGNSDYTLSFSNIKYLNVNCTLSTKYITMYNFKIS